MSEAKHFLPAAEVTCEIRIKNSRFISTCAPVFSVEEAKSWIQKIKMEHPSASHHVPAFIIGHGSSVISHCSDNGEPSGTAGKPTLAVLQGSGLGDALLITVRYFGGIKLGTGGLVRAYTESAQEVLKLVRRAEKIAVHTLMIEIPYALLEQTRRLIMQCGGIISDEAFQTDVLITCVFPVSLYDDFQTRMMELSNGQIIPVLMHTNPDAIFPVETSKAI
jgi:uncharacterized YigZ family protein